MPVMSARFDIFFFVFVFFILCICLLLTLIYVPSLPLINLSYDISLQFEILARSFAFKGRRECHQKFVSEDSVLPADLIRTDKPTLEEAFHRAFAYF